MRTWETKDVDKGLGDIVQDLISIAKSDVTVGFHADGTMSEDGQMTMVDLAMQNDKGSNDGHVPSRPFMDQTAVENHNEITSIQTGVIKKVIGGSLSPKRGLVKVGESYKKMTQRTIDRFSTPANADSTIRNKRSGVQADNPLVDTGTMRDSITVRVGGLQV